MGTAHTTQRTIPEGMKRQIPAEKITMSVMGSMNFHAKFINWSMRRRGSVPRIQMNTEISAISLAKNHIHDGMKVKNDNGAAHPPRNSVTASPLIANIPRYSPRKNSANLKPEYSVKYPAIISDSPSGRSNGERFDSAVAAIINRRNPAIPHGVNTYQWYGHTPQYPACRSTIVVVESDPAIITTAIDDRISGAS